MAPLVRIRRWDPKEDCCDPRAKLLHFVRHAEGHHNVHRHLLKTMKCHDAKLTERGEEQCMELRRGAAMHVRPEVVGTSPLTRTVQTASLAFGGCGAA